MQSVQDSDIVSNKSTKNVKSEIPSMRLEVRVAVPYDQRDCAFTPSGGGDMEIHKLI